MNGWLMAIVIATQTLPKQDANELRPRVTLSGTAEFGAHARVHVDGIAEALVADRAKRGGRVNDFNADARDAWIEVGGKHADVRAGYGRLAWGRLDEVQPSDVINPIDTARFFLDGRSEARLPVAFTRARWFASSSVTVEGVLVPFFRRSRFDSLDEATSPFNLLNDAAMPVGTVATGFRRALPERLWSNVQGGGRVSATAGRVDVSVSAYRGYRGFGDINFEPSPTATQQQVSLPIPGRPIVGELVERFPRFTMFAADAETVTGAWAWRGEAALFKDDSFDIGAGVDRKTGEYRVFGSVLMHRDFATTTAAATNVNIVGSIERKFSQDHYLARIFGVANPGDRSGFARAVFVWSASDRVAIEATAAKFMGDGDDTISRFAGRDFVMARLRYYLR